MSTSESFALTLLSPIRCLAKEVPVEFLTLTTGMGQIEILSGHAHLLGILEPGIFEYQLLGLPTVRGFISRGFFEVGPQFARVMAETLELKEEVDLLRAQLAQKKAEEVLSESNLDDTHLKKYQLKLQRSLIRQGLASAR